jgi:hypothetical protein
MRLNEHQIQQVEGQTGARVVPQEHPSLAELESHFGEHTFFLDDEGLHVWRRPSDSESESSKLVGIRLATWSDEKRAALVPHEPAAVKVLPEIN